MKQDLYGKLSVLPLQHLFKKTKKSMRVVLFGNFGAMNSGDEAILAGQIHELKKIQGVSLTVIARYPEKVKKMHKVSSVSILSFFSLVRIIASTDAVIVGGGGLICKTDTRVLSIFYQLYCYMLFYAYPLVLKKDTYALGIGIYQNASPLILRLGYFFLRRFTKVTVRDFHSFTLLKKQNIDVTLYKDNSFLMPLVPAQSLPKKSFLKAYRKEKLHVGISLRKRDNEKDTAQLVREIAEFVAAYADTADFWYYSLESSPSWDDDKKIGQRIYQQAKKLRDGKPLFFQFVPTNLHPKILFSTFELMQFFISMRLHSSIFCYRIGVPFIGFSYDKKCTSFLRSIGKKPIPVERLSRYIIRKTVEKREVYENKQLSV